MGDVGEFKSRAVEGAIITRNVAECEKDCCHGAADNLSNGGHRDGEAWGELDLLFGNGAHMTYFGVRTGTS